MVNWSGSLPRTYEDADLSPSKEAEIGGVFYCSTYSLLSSFLNIIPKQKKVRYRSMNDKNFFRGFETGQGILHTL